MNKIKLLKRNVKHFWRLFKKRTKLFLLTKLLRGNNVICSICDGKFTTFIPYMTRINACCPNCGSLERTRLLWYFIQKKELLKHKINLLHVAPEKYLYSLFDRNENIDYHPIDLFTKGYSYPPKTVEMDVTDLKFKKESIDGIICMHVLEHVLDDIKALNEFYKVLKPNAWAIIQVPFDKNKAKTYEDTSIVSTTERFKHFGQTDHVRIYGVDFINRFESVGFKVEDWNFQNTISEEIKKAYVFKEEDIFLLRKPQG
jgi:SAM-dependent methyltransferase